MNGEHHLLGARAGAARLPETHVPRRRLDNLLGDRARRPVTLVSAPPGSGKTTLVTSALARRPDAVSLIVDRRDDQTGHLARLVVAALVRHGAVSMEVDAGVAPATLLDALFAAVEAGRRRAVLVLDDVHELTSADALDTLAYLVEHAPVGLDVVLCSRADPPLRLTRLRLADRLGEIRGGALAFERAEAAELLSAHGVRLTRNQLDALWQRTQGWAAGLQLAACALQGDPDPREVVDSVARTESVIVAYLLEELLNRQDEAAEEFLLRTSVAARVTPELAEVLTGDPAAGERLAELERHGVFAAEVDGRNWYRYHALFATLLEGHLRHRRRDLADELHRRAAGWFLDRGLLFEAESHARAAGDWTLVDRLATHRWIDRSLAGDDAADGLLAGVPAAAVASRAGLAVLAAADACSRHDRPAADTHRQCADSLAPDLADSDGASPATALLDIAYARAFGADDRAVAAVASLTGRSAGDRSGGDTAARGLAQLAALRGVGLALDVGAVERAAQAADELAVAAAGTWIGAEALSTLALAEAVAGDVAGSERHIRATVAGYDPGRTSLSQAAALAFAVVHALRGEPQHALDVLATVGDVVPSPDRWLGAVRSAVRAGLRNPGAAVATIDQGDLRHPLADRALVALGVLETVDADGRVRVLGGPLEADVLLARQRWRAGDAAGAMSALDGRSEASPPAGHPRTVVERSSLVALAVGGGGGGGTEARVAALRAAFDAAAATGIVAPLLALTPDLAPLLERHATDLGRHQELALDLVDRARRSPAPAFIEPLTERETAVLRQLPTLMSNLEIASGLHLSVNTVKTHLKSLYRKLGVTSRREAVQRGRALELL